MQKRLVLVTFIPGSNLLLPGLLIANIIFDDHRFDVDNFDKEQPFITASKVTKLHSTYSSAHIKEPKVLHKTEVT